MLTYVVGALALILALCVIRYANKNAELQKTLRNHHDRQQNLHDRLMTLEDRFYNPANYNEAFIRPTGKKKEVAQ